MKDQGFIEVDGFKLRYVIEGSGQPAIVIGSSVYYPRSFSQNLRKSLQLIFVDWRGFAEVSSSHPTRQPSFAILLDDIELVRQKLGLEKCIVIGHSAHALLALEYAKKYSQHVSNVIMIGVSPNFNADHAKMAERNWEESVWPERKAALAKRIGELSDQELEKLLPPEKFIRWYVRRDPQAWFDFHFDSSSLWKGIVPNMAMLDFLYGEALRDLDITKGLDQFHLPVFLALGRFDFIVAPPSSWDPLRKKFKRLTVRIFERSGHSPQYEEADLFDEEILSWLKQVDL